MLACAVTGHNCDGKAHDSSGAHGRGPFRRCRQHVGCDVTILEVPAEYMRLLYPSWSLPHALPHPSFLSTFPADSEWGARTASAMTNVEIDYANHLLTELSKDGVPGDIIEFGVYQGFWLTALADQRERIGANRHVWGLDSFQGLPATTERDLSCWQEGMYAADFESVSRTLRTSERGWITLKKGWFSETLQQPDVMSIKQIAFARIDCDLYAPTVECLEFLTTRLVPGAVLVFDDWTFDPEKGETRAALEWLAGNPGISLEFLHTNALHHLYFRVKSVPTPSR